MDAAAIIIINFIHYSDNSIHSAPHLQCVHAHMQIPVITAFILLHIYSECVHAHMQIPGKYCLHLVHVFMQIHLF